MIKFCQKSVLNVYLNLCHCQENVYFRFEFVQIYYVVSLAVGTISSSVERFGGKLGYSTNIVYLTATLILHEITFAMSLLIFNPMGDIDRQIFGASGHAAGFWTVSFVMVLFSIMNTYNHVRLIYHTVRGVSEHFLSQ